MCTHACWSEQTLECLMYSINGNSLEVYLEFSGSNFSNINPRKPTHIFNQIFTSFFADKLRCGYVYSTSVFPHFSNAGARCFPTDSTRARKSKKCNEIRLLQEREREIKKNSREENTPRPRALDILLKRIPAG